jgi:ferric-dicitrate binding protein FerR (iron transport regulator)
MINDDVTVVVGPASEITYTQEKADLTGEAFFEVKPGKSYEVHTPNGIVKGYSANFRVISRRTTMNVFCNTGTLKVSNVDGGAEVEISGGEYVSFRGKNMANRAKKTPNQMTSDKFFVFDSESLLYVFEALEAQYAIDIIPGEVNTNLNYSGAVLRDNMDIALAVIFTPLNVDYSVDANRVILTKRE